MDDVYDRGYRKIALLGDLKLEQPRVFRSGGAFILLLRSHFGVRAADVTHCFDAGQGSGAKSLEAIAGCLTGDDLSSIDWQSAIAKRVLPLEQRGDDLWVCVDQCSGA